MENEKSNDSIVNFAFVIAGFLAFYMAGVLLDIAANTFGSIANLRNQPFVAHGFPVAAGVITFLILFMNKNVRVLADEAVTEARKVVWPSRKDTWAMTMVVCVMVLISGLGFGVFDFISSRLIQVFVN
jgi:preprotein translocase subunit SecE